AQVAAVDLALARLARMGGRLGRLELRRQRADHRGTDRELDARKPRLLGLPARQHPLGVVGLDPALEKARGHRQLDGIPFAAVEFHAREPTRIDVVAHFGPKAVLHTRPAVLVHARHIACLFFSIGTNDGGTRWRRDTWRRALDAGAT